MNNLSAHVRLRSVVVMMIVFTLAGQHAVLAADGEPTRPQTIRESVTRYVRDHPSALAQVSPPPPGPGPKRFPWRTMLIGFGIGCGFGVHAVDVETEGFGHHTKDKLRMCGYLGAIGVSVVIVH
jgi:hypothetical protein